MISDKIKAPDVLRLEVDSLEGKDDKINLTIGNSLLNKSSFDLGSSRDWAKESLFELGYKAVTTSKNSTFWLDGLYTGDLDCSVAFCKNS